MLVREPVMIVCPSEWLGCQLVDTWLCGMFDTWPCGYVADVLSWHVAVSLRCWCWRVGVVCRCWARIILMWQSSSTTSLCSVRTRASTTRCVRALTSSLLSSPASFWNKSLVHTVLIQRQTKPAAELLLLLYYNLQIISFCGTLPLYPLITPMSDYLSWPRRLGCSLGCWLMLVERSTCSSDATVCQITLTCYWSCWALCVWKFDCENDVRLALWKLAGCEIWCQGDRLGFSCASFDLLLIIELLEVSHSHLRIILSRCACSSARCSAFSALTLLVGWQEGYPACKKWGMVEVGTG